jgi:hypothetical protein
MSSSTAADEDAPATHHAEPRGAELGDVAALRHAEEEDRGEPIDDVPVFIEPIDNPPVFVDPIDELKTGRRPPLRHRPLSPRRWLNRRSWHCPKSRS